MTLTKDQVLRKIYPDEPNYENAAKLGPDALEHIETIMNEEEPILAAKAVSLASRIKDERAVQILIRASKHPHRIVRVAAAAGSRRFDRDAANKILESTLKDSDEGVRLMGLKANR